MYLLCRDTPTGFGISLHWLPKITVAVFYDKVEIQFLVPRITKFVICRCRTTPSTGVSNSCLVYIRATKIKRKKKTPKAKQNLRTVTCKKSRISSFQDPILPWICVSKWDALSWQNGVRFGLTHFLRHDKFSLVSTTYMGYLGRQCFPYRH